MTGVHVATFAVSVFLWRLIFQVDLTLAKVIKGGGSLTVFPKFSRPSWTKMSEISINTVENIDEIDQIILLTTCTTKLHRYYRVTLHFLDFHQKNFPEIPPPPFITPPFITFTRVIVWQFSTKKIRQINLIFPFWGINTFLTSDLPDRFSSIRFGDWSFIFLKF